MSIRFNEKTRVFSLTTRHTEYQMKINDIGVLLHTYYGERVDAYDMSYLYRQIDRGFSGNPYEARAERNCSLDLMPQEYSGNGVGDYRVSAVRALSDIGSPSVDFRYENYLFYNGKYNIKGLPFVRENASKVDTLVVNMVDKVLGLEADLYYGVIEDKDIITRHVTLRNVSDQTIDVNKAASVCIDFLNKDMDFIHFHGRHCMERQPERLPVSYGIHTISSKRGMSSHQENPFVILCDKDATENDGDCYGFMLMYSGNHKTEIEKDQAGTIRLVMGINDNDFCWKLEAGQEFNTPETILAYSPDGLNELSNLYHRIIRENVCPQKFMDMKRPVLINNWEATYFDFNAEKIMAIADQAAELGVQMFVLDDGWFGKRDDDNSSLGDWYVNEKKLPGGVKKIADYVNSLGMKFGLWFEPEMINEDSDLYRTHPDWVIKEPARVPSLCRNQLLLDMSRSEVVDYIFDSMSKVLDSANIEYIKWDFNRSLSDFYSNGLRKEQQGELTHRFVLGTYSLYQKLTDRYPNLLIEGCSGGGGRFDAGILFYSPQIWTSDDTDAIARLKIQKGTSYGYPVSAMGAHVSAVPNHQTGRTTSLKTRGVVAMAGTFGYELDLRKLSAKEKEEVRQQIKTFDKYYWLIQKGKYYRLTDVETDSYYNAWEVVSEDRKEALVSIVVTDPHANPLLPHVRLYGLDKEKTYILESLGDKTVEPEETMEFKAIPKVSIEISGRALMQGGYTFEPLFGNYPAEQFHIIEK